MQRPIKIEDQTVTTVEPGSPTLVKLYDDIQREIDEEDNVEFGTAA